MEIVMEQVHREVEQRIGGGRLDEAREKCPALLLELTCLGFQVEHRCSHGILLHKTERDGVEGTSSALTERTKLKEMQPLQSRGRLALDGKELTP